MLSVCDLCGCLRSLLFILHFCFIACLILLLSLLDFIACLFLVLFLRVLTSGYFCKCELIGWYLHFRNMEELVAGLFVLSLQESDKRTSKTPQRVPLQSIDVAATVNHVAAQVTLTQVYLNEFDTHIEAVYRFPIDEQAAVCGFEVRSLSFSFFYFEIMRIIGRLRSEIAK